MGHRTVYEQYGPVKFQNSLLARLIIPKFHNHLVWPKKKEKPAEWSKLKKENQYCERFKLFGKEKRNVSTTKKSIIRKIYFQ